VISSFFPNGVLTGGIANKVGQTVARCDERAGPDAERDALFLEPDLLRCLPGRRNERLGRSSPCQYTIGGHLILKVCAT